MVPARLSFVTYNLWTNERWRERAGAVGNFLELFAPDVLCVQELHRTSQAFIDRKLTKHARVHDRFAGWTYESNIYWDGTIFEEVEHGGVAVGHLEPKRRLFWVRLKLKSSATTIFVSTAHLTPPKHPIETATGRSPRVRQLKRIGAALSRLVRDEEPAFFMGDMNDARHPQRVLKEAGFTSCFAALGVQTPPTFRCYPTSNVKPGEASITEAIDLIVANEHARAIAASVPQCYHGDMAPSDHWPVQAVYQLT